MCETRVFVGDVCRFKETFLARKCLQVVGRVRYSTDSALSCTTWYQLLLVVNVILANEKGEHQKVQVLRKTNFQKIPKHKLYPVGASGENTAALYHWTGIRVTFAPRCTSIESSPREGKQSGRIFESSKWILVFRSFDDYARSLLRHAYLVK